MRPSDEKEAGFLEDYSKLEKINDNYSRWKDLSFTRDTCPRVIVDPIQFNLGAENKTDFSAEEIREPPAQGR